jgi:hypothetical protein
MVSSGKIHWLAWKKLLLPKCYRGLGFRDLCLFNQAMLARQAWRLIQFTDSLCARLLKAKYFPHGELVDTAFPVDMSPTWHGMLHGLDLGKEGIIWQVRLGSKIKIWRDPWISRPPSRRIPMKKGRSRMRWVSKLMLPAGQAWDEKRLRMCLFPHDVEEVLKIRLLNRSEKDFIACHYEHFGIFTVKSAYKLALRREYNTMGNKGSSSSADGSWSLYKALWSAKVPPKVRLLAWKLSEEGLATQDNRKRCTLVRNDICNICGMEKETGYHAVVRCSKATALRAEMRRHWTLPAEELLHYTGPAWLLLLLQELNEDQRAKIMMVFWRAWHLRNDIIHGKGQGQCGIR